MAYRHDGVAKILCKCGSRGGIYSTYNNIQEHHNIILLETTGGGKTHLACTLGMAAGRRFFVVKYIRLLDLLVEFQIARGKRHHLQAHGPVQEVCIAHH